MWVTDGTVNGVGDKLRKTGQRCRTQVTPKKIIGTIILLLYNSYHFLSYEVEINCLPALYVLYSHGGGRAVGLGGPINCYLYDDLFEHNAPDQSVCKNQAYSVPKAAEHEYS